MGNHLPILNNKTMVDRLVERSGHIRSQDVEGVFRAVDRAMYFEIDEGEPINPYEDDPWRRGTLHLSAPCIYAKVLEALDLKPGLSFLNLGSGTGYLNTLVGLLVGPHGINHGIEIHADVVEYAYNRLKQFKQKSYAIDKYDFAEPIFIRGNCLNLNPDVKYDRIYLGAACLPNMEMFIKKLIKPNGGILVMPVENQLMRHVRVGENEWKSDKLLDVSFTLMIGQLDDSDTRMIDMPLARVKSLKELCRISIRQQLRARTNTLNPSLLNSDNIAKRMQRKARIQAALMRRRKQAREMKRLCADCNANKKRSSSRKVVESTRSCCNERSALSSDKTTKSSASNLSNRVMTRSASRQMRSSADPVNSGSGLGRSSTSGARDSRAEPDYIDISDDDGDDGNHGNNGNTSNINNSETRRRGGANCARARPFQDRLPSVIASLRFPFEVAGRNHDWIMRGRQQRRPHPYNSNHRQHHHHHHHNHRHHHHHRGQGDADSDDALGEESSSSDGAAEYERRFSDQLRQVRLISPRYLRIDMLRNPNESSSDESSLSESNIDEEEEEDDDDEGASWNTSDDEECLELLDDADDDDGVSSNTSSDDQANMSDVSSHYVTSDPASESGDDSGNNNDDDAVVAQDLSDNEAEINSANAEARVPPVASGSSSSSSINNDADDDDNNDGTESEQTGQPEQQRDEPVARRLRSSGAAEELTLPNYVSKQRVVRSRQSRIDSCSGSGCINSRRPDGPLDQIRRFGKIQMARCSDPEVARRLERHRLSNLANMCRSCQQEHVGRHEEIYAHRSARLPPSEQHRLADLGRQIMASRLVIATQSGASCTLASRPANGLPSIGFSTRPFRVGSCGSGRHGNSSGSGDSNSVRSNTGLAIFETIYGPDRPATGQLHRCPAAAAAVVTMGQSPERPDRKRKRNSSSSSSSSSPSTSAAAAADNVPSEPLNGARSSSSRDGARRAPAIGNSTTDAARKPRFYCRRHRRLRARRSCHMCSCSCSCDPKVEPAASASALRAPTAGQATMRHQDEAASQTPPSTLSSQQAITSSSYTCLARPTTSLGSSAALSVSSSTKTSRKAHCANDSATNDSKSISSSSSSSSSDSNQLKNCSKHAGDKMPMSSCSQTVSNQHQPELRASTSNQQQPPPKPDSDNQYECKPVGGSRCVSDDVPQPATSRREAATGQEPETRHQDHPLGEVGTQLDSMTSGRPDESPSVPSCSSRGEHTNLPTLVGATGGAWPDGPAAGPDSGGGGGGACCGHQSSSSSSSSKQQQVQDRRHHYCRNRNHCCHHRNRHGHSHHHNNNNRRRHHHHHHHHHASNHHSGPYLCRHHRLQQQQQQQQPRDIKQPGELTAGGPAASSASAAAGSHDRPEGTWRRNTGPWASEDDGEEADEANNDAAIAGEEAELGPPSEKRQKRGATGPSGAVGGEGRGHDDQEAGMELEEKRKRDDEKLKRRKRRRRNECERYHNHISGFIRELPLPNVLLTYLNYERAL